MNPLIMQLKIKLAEAQREQEEYSLKLSRLFFEMGMLLNPHFEDVKEVEGEKIKQAGDEILDTVIKMRELKRRIASIKEDLG